MRAEWSSAARTGAFIAVGFALFCIQIDCGVYAPSLATAWWACAPAIACCGPGWTFSTVTAQQAVAPFQVGEASRVPLTFLVAVGLIALAAAAAAIAAMTPESPQEEHDAIPRCGGLVFLAVSGVVTVAVRHRPVVRGKARTLSMRAPWPHGDAPPHDEGAR
ncbi:hypothetical protein [Streptomyces sp. NPDC059175]|uniref:hypothetical protein n=1 Tax=unclassified Streptomyces TaxID=2593676 RepID=UPI003695BBCE